MNYNIPAKPAVDKRPFVKLRELVGEEFSISKVREGTSKFGPSWYVDVTRSNGEKVVLGVGKERPAGQQISELGNEKMSEEGLAWTVVEEPLSATKKRYLFATLQE